MGRKRYTKREMEKIYKRRRIILSFVSVLVAVLIGYGIFSFLKYITKNKSQDTIPKQEDQILDSTGDKDQLLKANDDKKDELYVNVDSKYNSEDNSEVQNKNQPLGEKKPKGDIVEVQGKSTDWNLILANPDTVLPADFKVETSIVQGTKEVDTRIVNIAKTMIDDARKDGIELLVCSGYRSIEKQQSLFDNSINGYIDLGYSKANAIKYTKSYYAVPGTSEHHTGLAMDIVTPSYQTLDDKYAQTDAAKWLLNNAYRYGFILRYSKDKEEITKIAYEPWHYRYVGEEHAKIIKEKNLCFEEYLGTL